MKHNASARYLGVAIFVVLAAILALLATETSTQARKHQHPAKAAAPTETETPTPAPTPEVKSWNFDQDEAGKIAKGWTAVEGDWTVIGDPGAPSAPNTFGLGPGRLLTALTKMLEYYPIAVLNDPTEYDDFTLEASFKAVGGRLDCSAGLILHYVDPKTYYVLAAGCPSDYFALMRVSNGVPEIIKQAVVPIDKNMWYQLKVVVSGDHFACYAGKKMVFDVADNKIAKGRIGLWARADAQVRFDNVTLTLAPKAESGAASSGGPEAPPPPAAPPAAGGSENAPPPQLPP